MKCQLCQEETEDFIECDNCELLVCQNCFENEGAVGPNSGVNLCNKCLDILDVCENCNSHIPSDFIKVCPICSNSYCDECIDTHKC